jgi:hypothetical protein
VHRIQWIIKYNAYNSMHIVQCLKYNAYYSMHRIQCKEYIGLNIMHGIQCFECIEYNAWNMCAQSRRVKRLLRVLAAYREQKKLDRRVGEPVSLFLRLGKGGTSNNLCLSFTC